MKKIIPENKQASKTTPGVYILATEGDRSYAQKLSKRLKKKLADSTVSSSLDSALGNIQSKIEHDVIVVVYSNRFKLDWSLSPELENALGEQERRTTSVVIIDLVGSGRSFSARGATVLREGDEFGVVFEAITKAISRVENWRLMNSGFLYQKNSLPIPLSVSRAKRKSQDVFGMNRLDEIESDYYIHRQRPDGELRWREEVLKSLARGQRKVIPSWLHYCTYEGTNAWIERCQSQDYTFYTESIRVLKKRLNRIIEIVSQNSVDPEIDYISIGCGDGVKDAHVLSYLSRKISKGIDNECIFYYPLDVSIHMIDAATAKMPKLPLLHESRSRIRVMGLLGDVSCLPSFSAAYEQCRGNNLFAVLGNTIGNDGEEDVFLSLQTACVENDLVLIEYNAMRQDVNSMSSFGSDENLERHWTAVLTLDKKATFVSRGVRALEIDEPGRSRISRVSFMTYARGVNFSMNRGRQIPEIGLGILHCYDKECIGTELDRRGFTVLYNDVSSGVGLVLCKRRGIKAVQLSSHLV
jgi:hypothetical protein